MPFQLTREAWKEFKTDNELSKSKGLNKADVGPHIAAVWTALETWEREGGWKSINSFIHKLEDLQTAFTKFVALKEAKQELSTEAFNQIMTWKKQLNDAIFGIRDYKDRNEPELKQEDRNQLQHTLQTLGFRH